MIVNMQHFFNRAFSFIMVTILFIGMFPLSVSATTDRTTIPGKIYEFSEDGHYEFCDSDNYRDTVDENTYGSFTVNGNIVSIDQENGIPTYEVTDGDLRFYYNYTDTFLNAGLDSWHLVEDKSKKVNDLTLDTKIRKGAIILQTSKDRINWITVGTTTNAFADTPIRTDAIYTTTEVQLINGCYYRIIVVYELSIRTKQSNFLFINTDKYENKKYAEVYEFYAYINSEELSPDTQTDPYILGQRVRVEDFDTYHGEQPITEDDPHKDWDLGQFHISGYTSDVLDTNGNVVFLKNVGDQVTLWFSLNENIDRLRGNENLSITADSDGYDQYFEKGPMDFGKGALFIRYTDRNNHRKVTTYTNFLEANATAEADTRVQLFEEGDYEVALDYEITDNRMIDRIYHYRIFFQFSVRNGNCMVYPFDVVTGNELTTSSMTENGFRLDLAKSRYLRINIKREVLKSSADGLVEDTRFNGPAKDGAEYTEEGIYTITVSNEYTGQFTVKKIYVGTNNVLKAHMTTGLSIPEINDLVAKGATISDEGTIQLSNKTPNTEPPTHSPAENSSTGNTTIPTDDITSEAKTPSYIVFTIVAMITIVCVTVILIIIRKKHRADQITVVQNNGGDKE